MDIRREVSDRGRRRGHDREPRRTSFDRRAAAAAAVEEDPPTTHTTNRTTRRPSSSNMSYGNMYNNIHNNDNAHVSNEETYRRYWSAHEKRYGDERHRRSRNDEDDAYRRDGDRREQRRDQDNVDLRTETEISSSADDDGDYSTDEDAYLDRIMAVHGNLRGHLVILFLVLVVVVVGVCMGIYKPWRRDVRSSETSLVGPTSPPTSLRDRNRAALLRLVTERNVTTRSDVLSPSADTPQSRALDRLAADAADDAVDLEEPDDLAKDAAVAAYVQKYALLTLYHATTDDADQSWIRAAGWNGTDGTGACDWYGVGCGDATVVDEDEDENDDPGNERRRERQRLRRQRRRQRGLLNAGLDEADLPTATSLRLDGNGLRGTLPSEICALTALVRVDLSDNSLRGRLPNCLARLVSLTHLRLANNELTGELPRALYRMRSLVDLRLSDNALNGTLSDQSDRWRRVRTLHLRNNSLVGALPRRIGRWSAMEDLDLSDNAFDGPLPVRLSRLSASRRWNLSRNALTGTVPPRLGEASSLTDLLLDHNRLVGTVPERLGDLDALERVTLHANDFDHGSAVPDGLCALAERLGTRITADCKNGAVVCRCCQRCY